MQYDPIKKMLGRVFNTTPFLRRLFYRLLDLLLLRTWHVRRELKKWNRDHSTNGHILDAGSGFGQYSFFMAKKFRNKTIEGIDVKQEQIADCNRFFAQSGLANATFFYGDLTEYQKPSAYTLILSVDVMEHIEEDVKVFKNFYQSLKAHGMLLISTPSDQGGSDVHHHQKDEEDKNASFIDEHVRDGYSLTEIREKLKRAGFTKIQARYQYGAPGKISWKLSMKIPILLINASKIFFIVLPFYYLITFPFCMILNFLDVRMNHKSGTGLIVKAWK